MSRQHEEKDAWRDRIDKVIVERKPVRLTEEPEVVELLRQLLRDVEKLQQSRGR